MDLLTEGLGTGGPLILSGLRAGGGSGGQGSGLGLVTGGLGFGGSLLVRALSLGGVTPDQASSYTLSGPDSAAVGVPSAPFRVTPLGGAYTPTSLIGPGTSHAKTFIFTPSGAATGTISTTASRALGTDPTAVAFTASVPVVGHPRKFVFRRHRTAR